MKYKSIKLLLWAIFVLLLSIYVLNFGTNFWDLLSLGLMITAIVLAICSWITGVISNDEK